MQKHLKYHAQEKSNSISIYTVYADINQKSTGFVNCPFEVDKSAKKN